MTNEKKVTIQVKKKGRNDYSLSIDSMAVDLSTRANGAPADIAWEAQGEIKDFKVEFADPSSPFANWHGNFQQCAADYEMLGTPKLGDPNQPVSRTYTLKINTTLPNHPTIVVDPEVVVDDGGRGGHKRGRGRRVVTVETHPTRRRPKKR